MSQPDAPPVPPPPEPGAPPGDAAAPPAVPPIADGIDRPLDPRSITVDRIVGGIGAAWLSIALAAPLVITLVARRPAPLAAVLLVAGWLLLTGLLAWRAYAWPVVAHRHASYRVDGRGIEIRRGVFWRVVINVPRSRVQHTDVSQGPLERGHGLGTLVIYTAGTDHAKVDLHGLDHATALRIRDHLLPRPDEDDAV